MKYDLDVLMKEHELDAILVTGPAQHNPPMVYLTGGAHLTHADLIKKRGDEPILFYNPMERDEAAKTGLPSKSLADYPLNDLLKQTNGDYLAAMVMRYQKMLSDLHLTRGRMAVYGRMDAGVSYAIFSSLQKLMPDLTIFGELDNSVLMQAMMTKDEQEIERIRHVGQITIAVVEKVADFLTSQKVTDGILVKPDGTPITIAEVKSRINLWLAELGAENPEGTIFSVGRDAGVPHSSGNPQNMLRLGQTIVFDIFPCESGGGYYYDFTRTWCLGYAPDEALALYEDVREVYEHILQAIKPNTLCREIQDLACRLFEERNHPTIKSNPQTEKGYVHSLGHGLGLQVHERPWFGHNATEKDRLEPGVVTTIEPGLYYPEQGMGVRLEDTFCIKGDGRIEKLVDYPLDLILPVRQK